MASDPADNPKNFPTISSGVRTVTPFQIAFETVLKSIIATASFTIPSPNINEKSFGCSSYLIIEMAAITSEEQSKDAMTKQSLTSRSMTQLIIL